MVSSDDIFFEENSFSPIFKEKRSSIGIKGPEAQREKPKSQVNIESDTIYLTWQQNPATTMTIQWISLANGQDTIVSFALKSDSSEWKKSEGDRIKFPRSSTYFINRVELKNLKPDSQYIFRVYPFDQLFQFKTAPQTLEKELRFVEGGDMYHDGVEWMERTCRQAAKTDPLFALIGGDIAYAVGSAKDPLEKIDRWIEWIKAWHKTMVTPDGNFIPVIAAIGNHDLVGHFGQKPERAAIFSTLFPMPGPTIYNMIDFENYLTIALLDSGHANPVNGKQTSWLDGALQERQYTRHRFVTYHVPAYSSVRSFKSQQSKNIRRYWVPLFEKYGIQTVFEHHDHAYKRTFPLLKNKIHPMGIVYLGDGAWGVEHTRKPKNRKKRFYLAKFVSSRNFILVTLTKERQLFQGITDQGVIIDQYERAL